MISGRLKLLFPRAAGLLTAIFLVTQLAAMAHEIEHALDAHDEPCALHVAADQLAKAPAPEPLLTLAPAPAVEPALPDTHANVMRAPRHHDARAPPPSF